MREDEARVVEAAIASMASAAEAAWIHDRRSAEAHVKAALALCGTLKAQKERP